MLTVIHNDDNESKYNGGRSLLDEIVRDGARKMLAAALQAEVAAYIDQFADHLDEKGHLLVVCNGYHAERDVLTAAGAVNVKAPRVDDKRIDPETGERQRFSSAILPAWVRKSPQMIEVLPLLYLHGISTSDFGPALAPSARMTIRCRSRSCDAAYSVTGCPSGARIWNDGWSSSPICEGAWMGLSRYPDCSIERPFSFATCGVDRSRSAIRLSAYTRGGYFFHGYPDRGIRSIRVVRPARAATQRHRTGEDPCSGLLPRPHPGRATRSNDWRAMDSSGHPGLDARRCQGAWTVDLVAALCAATL